jgi:hypothetical protein
MFKNLFLLLFLLFGTSLSFGQISWKLNTDKDGIKIYTSLVPDSKIKAVKVECEVEATTKQLVALLLDVNSSAEWIYHTKSCALIKQVSPSELYYYSEISLPWPTENRDFVAHLKVTQDPQTKIVTIDGPAVPGFIPVKKGIVRIEHSSGKWVITPLSTGRVKIEYTLHVDPSGSIPAWLVNMFAANGPLQIFQNLKVQIQKPVYKNAAVPFIE